MNFELLSVCVKRKLTIIDYEQMVMEVQHIVDKERGTKLVRLDIDFDQENTQKILDIWMDVNCIKLLTRGDSNAKIFDAVEKERVKRKVMNYNRHNDVFMF